MNTVKLQIPIDIDLKERSLKRAKKLGFNSLQDLTRVLLTSFADERQVDFGTDSWGQPSPAAAARLNKASEDAKRDIKEGKLKTFSDPKDALEYLHSL